MLFLTVAAPAHAQTRPWGGVCVSGADFAADKTDDVATIQGLECLIANVFSVIISMIGMGGFVMMIVGSFRWLASGVSTKDTDKARGTFTYAVGGIVLALSAYIALNLLAEFTGVASLTTFRIPRSTETLQ